MVHNVAKFDIKKQPKRLQDGSPHPISFFSLFQYATQWEKFILAIGLVACSVTGITQAINALNFCELADALITYGGLNETSDEDNETFKQAIIQYAISDGLVIISFLIFKYAAIVSFNYAACNQVLRMRGLLFEAIMNWDVAWFDLNPSGELGSRINEDLAHVEDGIGEKIPMYCQFIIAFISSIILCFIYGWELSLVCILPAPVLFGLLFYITSNTAKQAKLSFNALAQAGSVAEEVFSAIRTVQAFDGKEKEIERYNERIRFAQGQCQKRELLYALFNGLQWIFFCLLNGLGVWYGIRLIVKQRHWNPEDIVYTPKTTLIIFHAISTSITHISLSSVFVGTLATAQAAGAKVLHLIKQIANIDPRANRGVMPSSCHGEISFRNVYFKYPSRPDVKVLRGFNLTIQKGEVVAIVGHSGCGKSTCIQLLQRFYDPDEGEVALDGIEIRSLNVNWLRDRIGVVGQEPVLFGTTIYENIRYGREDATENEIVQSAKVANAHDFILGLPKGYQTQVGERGTQLSGGQKQRIAIARALIRNPSILLLDEATSALDIKNEAIVQEALEKASKGRTTIIVAHRLSTIRNADKIVVMDKGQVVEMGGHNELMMKNGVYYHLVMNQTNTEISSPGSESPFLMAEMEKEHDKKAVSNHEILEETLKDENILLKPANTTELLKLHASDWPLLFFGCVSALLAGATIPLFAEMLGGFIGGLKYHDDDTLLRNGKLFAFLWIVMGFVTGIFLFLHSYFLGLAAESLTKYVRGLCFKAMLGQEMAWFDDQKNGTGMLCARLSAEAATLHHATGARIGNILMAIGIITVSFGLTIIHKWQMTIIAILFLPPIYITIWAEKKIRHREGVMKVEALGKSTKLVVELISNIRTVISLGRQKLFLKQYMDILTPAARRQKVNMHIRGFCFALTSSLTTMILMPMICYGCHLVLQDELSIEYAITIARAWATATVLVSNYMAYTPNVQRGLLAAANIFSLLKRQPKIADSNEIYRNVKSKSKGCIKFDSIDFGYPSSAGTKILHQFNLDVSQGQNIALVGPSGCGKSTCIQLLQRFYDVDAGKVSIDSEDVRSKTLRNLRFELGIVSQEATLFNRTIAENIAYGDNTRKVSLLEIVDAAKKANIHNFISSLPQGYETTVGDKGTQLSGGQKQRIAIARALIRNPKILLLDEATSALDIESEKIVQAALDLAKQGRTCITIAHRLATIIDADVIYVMKDGQIVERGSHKELLAMKGIYYGLYRSQNSRSFWK